MQKGQTLVEAIVVIGMVMLLVTGLISGTTASLKSSLSTKARSEATKYAEDGIEVIRSMRDGSWSMVDSYATGGKYCLKNDGSFGPPDATCAEKLPNGDINFTRTVTLTMLPDGKTIDVHETVTYQDGASLKTIPLDTYLTQWR